MCESRCGQRERERERERGEDRVCPSHESHRPLDFLVLSVCDPTACDDHPASNPSVHKHRNTRITLFHLFLHKHKRAAALSHQNTSYAKKAEGKQTATNLPAPRHTYALPEKMATRTTMHRFFAQRAPPFPFVFPRGSVFIYSIFLQIGN